MTQGAKAHRADRSQLAQLRAGSLEAAAALAPPDEHADLLALLTDYYRHVPDEDVLTRPAQFLLAALLSHRQLAERRAVGRAAVRVLTPGAEGGGRSGGHTVVEVVTDDMPFLVDSVTAELTRVGRAIHLVVHPQLRVRRDAAGVLVQVLGRPVHDDGLPPAPDEHVESWMHIEVDREPDAGVREQLADDLRRVLGDVRAAVEDFPAMRATAQRLADELASAPPSGIDPVEVAETERLLRWLADDSFTFLGYREHLLDTDDGEDVLRAVPGTGLGILRQDRPDHRDRSGHDDELSRSFGRLPPAARARAREPHLLVLTKANSRSTVHRPTYLDYLGIKTFDADGAVSGERRFLGLFTSAAYTEGVTRVPIVDRKVAEVLRRTGFAPESHSGKDLLSVLESFPRDEIFQSEVQHLLDTAMGVLQLQERRRTRLFLRRDEYGRFMSCLVFVPRDRYNTAVRLRVESVLMEALNGTSVEYATRVSESVLARMHLVVRAPAGQMPPDVDVDQLEARLVAAIRTWEEDLA
ncbi:MAG TPA: NAD-glutamate dehydrogenase, partial [Actinomycetales bacterium]